MQKWNQLFLFLLSLLCPFYFYCKLHAHCHLEEESLLQPLAVTEANKPQGPLISDVKHLLNIL